MRKKLLLCFLVIVLLVLAPGVIMHAYGQSGCKDGNWGSPLEGALVVKDPFKPTANHYGTDYKATDGDNVLAVADGVIDKIGFDLRQLSKPRARTGLMGRIRGTQYSILRK